MNQPQLHSDDAPAAKASWHVEKGIPLALIYMLAAQFVVGVWIASQAFTQLENNNARITALEQQRVSERLATLESQMVDSKQLLNNVNLNVLRMLENQAYNQRGSK